MIFALVMSLRKNYAPVTSVVRETMSVLILMM